MAFSLKDLERPQKRALICTIVGEGGLGKTTLAATFPKPVFIRTEDGTASIVGVKDIAQFPVVKTFEGLLEQLRSLAAEDHKFQTVVIDSVTQLNTALESEVVASDPKAKSIAQAGGGYGAGYMAVANLHGKVREACEFLNVKKGMNVVFLAHAESETVDPPDGDPYMRYTIRMNKRSVAHYSDNVDLVGFIKLKTYTTGEKDEKRKAISDGTRIMTCYPTASHISKNRFGIQQDLVLELGVNPLAVYLVQAEKPTQDKTLTTQEKKDVTI